MTRLNDMVTYNGLCQTLQGETAAESEIIMPDYCPGILKLVKTEANSLVRSQSVRGDRAYVEGVVEFTVSYLSDSADGLQCVTHQVPFSQTTQIRETDSSQISVTARVSYANARALSPQKLYVKATVETVTNVFAAESITLLDGETANEIEKKTEQVYLSDVLSVSQKVLKMSDSIEVTGASVSKILRYETCFAETDKKVINNKMIVKADMSLKIIYISADGSLCTQPAKFPISQVLEIGEAGEDAECVTNFSMSDCHFNIKDNQGKTTLDCDLEINIGAICYQNERIEIITDAFSTSKQTECVRKPVGIQKMVSVAKQADFKQSIQMENCTGILDVSVKPSVMSVAYDAEQGSIMCQGVFACGIVYTDTESDVLCSEKTVPFQVAVDSDIVPTNVRGSVELELEDLTHTFDGNDLILSMDTRLKGFVLVGKEYSAVSEVSFTDREEDPAQIVLCYANCGDDVWDIAKRYGASPAKIIERNGLSGAQLAENRMLFIAR